MEFRFERDGDVFEDLDRDGLALAGTTFTACEFHRCDFSEASLRGCHFTECRFLECNLTAADFTGTLLHSVEFDRCRLLGIDFSSIGRDALGLTATIEACDLSLTTFRELDLRGFSARSTLFREAEFLKCDLRSADLSDNDFAGARFYGNDLRGADFRGSRNYLVSPLDNRVRELKASLPEALGFLNALELELE